MDELETYVLLHDYDDYNVSVNKDHLLYKEEHSFQQGCKTCYIQGCEMNSYKVRKIIE